MEGVLPEPIEEPASEHAGVNGYPAGELPLDEATIDDEELAPEAPSFDEPTEETWAAQAEPEREPPPVPEEQPTVELRALPSQEAPQLPGPQRVTITEVVDDLLGPAPVSEEIAEGRVVDTPVAPAAPAPAAPAPSPRDAELAASVRATLAAHPGLLPGTVEIDVVGGVAQLHGWVARVDVAGQIEHVVTTVPGVQGVQSFLRLGGS